MKKKNTEEKMEIILVTGGAGFIGSHLVNRYSASAKVVVVDNLSTGRIENIKPSKNVVFIEGDIGNLDLLNQVFKKFTFTYIFHLAAVASVTESIENLWSTHLINQGATVLLLEQVRKKNCKLKRFVFSSSAAVYGNSALPVQTEADGVQPLSPYALDKYASEQFTLMYHQYYGVKTTAVRFFNVYGQNQNPASPYSGVVSLINDGLKHKLESESFEFIKYGDGEQTRDFVYIRDVIQALVLVAKEEKAIGEVYNIGSGKKTSLNELLAIYESASKDTINIQVKSARKGDITNSLADISKIKKLGYRSLYPITTGVAHYWNLK